MTMPAIKARVLKVAQTGDDFWSTIVTLDAGKNKLVVEGMEFYFAVGVDRRNISLRIESVSEKESTARISSIGGTDDGEYGPKVKMVFSSKMPKGFIEPG
jgi:hypothetical protein